MLRWRGAHLAAERSQSVSKGGWSEEQNTNRVGVAFGGATEIKSVF